ncbi:MAG TPA: 16S rRNA processing protein RimM, partial [Polyangia bacterium]
MLRPHGVRGVLRLRAKADLGRVEALWLDDTRFTVRHASRDKEDWLVTVEGLADRDAADALRGRTVRVRRE